MLGNNVIVNLPWGKQEEGKTLVKICKGNAYMKYDVCLDLN